MTSKHDNKINGFDDLFDSTNSRSGRYKDFVNGLKVKQQHAIIYNKKAVNIDNYLKDNNIDKDSIALLSLDDNVNIGAVNNTIKRSGLKDNLKARGRGKADAKSYKPLCLVKFTG